MKKIGIFYSFNTQKTSRVGKLIASRFEAAQVNEINVETIREEDILNYDYLILGSATWWDGELPNHWDEFVPALEDLDLSGKTVALFGLGNPQQYPDNFGDALGTLAEIVEACGAKVVGSSPTNEFEFDSSAAIRNGRFIGAMLDEDNESDRTPARIDAWLAEVKPHFV